MGTASNRARRWLLMNQPGRGVTATGGGLAGTRLMRGGGARELGEPVVEFQGLRCHAALSVLEHSQGHGPVPRRWGSGGERSEEWKQQCRSGRGSWLPGADRVSGRGCQKV
jgi:hypothetical protein